MAGVALGVKDSRLLILFASGSGISDHGSPMSSKISLKDIMESREWKSGKYQAIVKTLSDGRRVFCGIERKKRSSKYREKLLCNPPVPLPDDKNKKPAAGDKSAGRDHVLVLTDAPAAADNLPAGESDGRVGLFG